MAEEEKPEAKEGGDESGAGLEPPKKKLSKKLLIIIIVAGLVVVGGGVGVALFMMGSAVKEKAMTEGEAKGGHESADTKGGEDKDKKAKVTFYSLGDLMVNLSGDGKRPNYLKVKVSLELADEKDTAIMDSLKPRLIDNFQTYLRELRIDDLRGSAGLYRLREALLLRATEVAQPARIRDVLFQEMLVQ